MREKLLTLDKLSRKTQDPASTTTRRKKMISRIKLLQKKLYMLPLVVVMTDLATRRSKHQILVQELILT